ncbi:hypothetical protein C8Q80DRAFT_347518 [Daedaleopsis nitida]|nr:hypothetical protein C8Q80DRAFT_347518 [Daedaleopsis nitida]
MLPTLCSARLADQQTHCTEYARHDLCLCTTHIRERERSVRDYKLAGERAESLRPQAVLTLAELKSIQPVQADAARKATENYLDAVKEEARLRVAHTKRFYADGPVDGHHRRVEVLLEKVVNGMRFVDQLRDHKRGLEQTKAAERRRRMTFAGEQPRRREELDRRLHAQPRAGRAWQEPPQPYYSYSARSSARGASGPSLTVLFLVFAAIYFVYLLVLFWANHPVPASDHGGRSNVIHTNTNAFTRWAASQRALQPRAVSESGSSRPSKRSAAPPFSSLHALQSPKLAGRVC